MFYWYALQVQAGGKKGTRQEALLDKIWTNVGQLYDVPEVIEPPGKCDHNMVFWKPASSPDLDTGSLQYVRMRMMGHRESASFDACLQEIRYEPCYGLQSCQEQFEHFLATMDTLIETAFPFKTVVRHSNDKQWVTDGFRGLIRKR